MVGPTGSGKSTLGLLLARLWEPPPGTVFIGDVDVTTLPLERVRAALAWVPQDAFLFSRSLRRQRHPRPEGIDAAAVGRAADRGRASPPRSRRFPRGWDTVVGERG